MRYLMAVILVTCSMYTYAVQLEGLYSAKVAVKNQSAAVRNAAIGSALNKVVQKVSGRQSVLANTSLKKALSNTGSYVEQFQYMKRDNEASAYWLIVSFQKAALDKVLQQFSVPVWGSNRPGVLAWVAVDDGVNRYLVGAGVDDVIESLNQAAMDAGVAVTLPLFDLEDQQSLSFNDVWAGFSDHVMRASQRYGVKQVMFGRLLKTKNNSWRMNWTVVNSLNQSSNIVKSGSADDVLQQAFTQVAANLADVYAPYGVVTEGQLRLVISGVNDLSKFVEVTDYLASLDMVKKVGWNQVSGQKLVMELSVLGNSSVLKDVVALNKVLIPDSGYQLPIIDQVKISQPTQPTQPTLYYRVN